MLNMMLNILVLAFTQKLSGKRPKMKTKCRVGFRAEPKFELAWKLSLGTLFHFRGPRSPGAFSPSSTNGQAFSSGAHAALLWWAAAYIVRVSLTQIRIFTHAVLISYAAKLFPHHEMYRWLSYGNGMCLPVLCDLSILRDPYSILLHVTADGKHPQADAGFFQKREFCFTLDGDIFVRYQSFKVWTDDLEESSQGIIQPIAPLPPIR